MKKGTFSIKIDALPRLANNISKAFGGYDKDIEKRVTKGTEIVWRVAHQKRPMITAAQARLEGRGKDRSGKQKRVSDPNAQAGVPVQTGRLQGSITKDVRRLNLMSFQGTIATKGIPYAGYVEYGTRKMKARPFMRPAILLTKDALKRTLGVSVQSNF